MDRHRCIRKFLRRENLRTNDLEVGSFTIDTRVTTKSQDFFSTSQNSSVISPNCFCTWLLCQSTRDVLCSSLWISFPTRTNEVSRWHIPDCGSHIQGGILECFFFEGGWEGPFSWRGWEWEINIKQKKSPRIKSAQKSQLEPLIHEFFFVTC